MKLKSMQTTAGYLQDKIRNVKKNGIHMVSMRVNDWYDHIEGAVLEIWVVINGIKELCKSVTMFLLNVM